MSHVSVLAHDGLAFANPLAEADVERAIDAMNLSPRARVVETGCGSAELLLRVLERYPSALGMGVDPDAEWLDRARAKARARGLGERAEFVQAAAEEAGLRRGSFDAVVNVAASHAHGGYRGALGALAALLRPGGVALFGEGFWAHAPSAAFLEALGGATQDELPSLDELVREARRVGLTSVFQAVASPDDWARYELTLAANAEEHGGPEADAYARRIRDRRALPEGDSTLGFALLVLGPGRRALLAGEDR